MYGNLIFLDLALVLLTLVVAPIAGLRASRRWLAALAALALGRLALACALLTGSLLLADTRLLTQVPLALVPALWAAWRPGRTAARLAAAGGLLSVWWVLVPFGPQDALLVLAGSMAALTLIGALSTAVDRRRGPESRLSRLSWLVVAFLLVPGGALVAAGQANASEEHPGRHEHGARDVARLTGPTDRTPDARFTMIAARTRLRLASGRTVDGLAFNGRSPGPELRVTRGQLVEVTLVNTDVTEGVTLHWHGVDVPNAEDGVPGVTQDAVRPGGRHVYRFVPDRAGTFWYHTHRDGGPNVRKGLFGALIVDEAPGFEGFERTVFTHAWPGGGDGTVVLDRLDEPAKEAVPAGRRALVRLINSSTEPQTLRVSGVAFRVAALDGNPIVGAGTLRAGTDLVLAAGGRYDVAFTMPPGAVTVALPANPDTALTFSPDATADAVTSDGGEVFDRLTYGSGGSRPAPGGHQRTFDLRLDDGFGFSQGGLSFVSSLINGRLYPAVPSLRVAEGDRVRVRIASRSTVDHPFHLHGHRVRVLSRNGAAVTGSPWWTDTLNVATGEAYELEFVADNPGIWMDHCHNFRHAADGMILHLAYEGVGTPFSSAHAPE